MTTAQTRPENRSADFAPVTPIKARACDPRRSRWRIRQRKIGTELKIMRRGAERC
ncbi:hypothetical protein [Mycobacterium bourgelatii]|uniref:Uncharacterized protein n=1 Tax=Mycobacterium bourgelatii TaxID=1273442 RepID=A0A7I9YYX3_MYCBU|nr:hypothetical protein [Mycobacterium bourgelatii]MCV6976482.1 hypothetical protein [Mycobacterium bourgelatii]GFG93929.1 hypothetical protein MBOU_59710 [Mycobacterium bourgelatii]